jgi:DNA (cytosine-5)-methyltransferase 1
VRLLDLFCSAGGAGEGYRRAGFEVTGVDLVRRSCGYPAGDLIVADVLDLLTDGTLRLFDAIHASPPCQDNSRTKHLRDAQGKKAGKRSGNLIPQVREALERTGLPYVIENVEGSDLRPDLVLCGSMFPELAVTDETGRRWLKRHRVFESNVLLMPPSPCDHKGAGVRPLGVYGSMRDDIPSGGQTCRSVEQARELMGCPWMSWKALTEAIPPAYTEWIGGQVAASLTVEGAA